MVGNGSGDLVLNCYRLARWYHQSPLHFLAMPLSEIDLHLMRSNQLAMMLQTPIDKDDG